MDETTFTFRPRLDNLQWWRALEQICSEKDIPMSALLNSILAPIAAELAKQEKTKTGVYELNLGMIRIE